jgi:chromosome segregation ATPase
MLRDLSLSIVFALLVTLCMVLPVVSVTTGYQMLGTLKREREIVLGKRDSLAKQRDEINSAISYLQSKLDRVNADLRTADRDLQEIESSMQLFSD